MQATAKTVQDAQQQAATAMDAVMNALTSNGIDKKDIKTQFFNISQSRQVINNVETINYVVSNSVTAKIRQVANAGKIIDAVAGAGGNLTRVQNISFTVEDPTPFLNQARDQAMANARAKADQLARLAGVKLGNPLAVTESGATVPPPRPLAAAPATSGASAPETPISPGEIQITLTVQVRYAID